MAVPFGAEGGLLILHLAGGAAATAAAAAAAAPVPPWENTENTICFMTRFNDLP